MPSSRLSPKLSSTQRNIAIAGGIVLLHAGALYALQTGLLRRAVEVIVPVELLAAVIPPALLTPPPPPAPPPAAPPPPPNAPVPKTTATPPPAPQPVAIADTTPAPSAPTGVGAPQPPAPPAPPAPVQAAPTPPAPAAPPAPPAPPPAPPAPVQPPVLDASYSANADLFRPPPMSVRLNEHGRVMLRLTIGTNGSVVNASLVKSSGFERLDQAALKGARLTKFRPATRAGVPVEWTYLLPVDYPESE